MFLLFDITINNSNTIAEVEVAFIIILKMVVLYIRILQDLENEPDLLLLRIMKVVAGKELSIGNGLGFKVANGITMSVLRLPQPCARTLTHSICWVLQRDETLPPNHPAPVPRPAHIPLTSPPNPFAPLRKRLMRTINTGKRVVVVEVQLILELVDALENYIKSIESSCTTTASSNSTSGSIKSFTEAGSGASSTPVNSMPESSSNLLSEVLSREALSRFLTLTREEANNRSLLRRSLVVKELCEIAPEVQRCLSQGQYGPLAHQPPRAPPMPESLSMALRSSNWWPRRLSRDCRGLLEEVGLSPPGGGSNNRANSNSHHQGNVVLLSPTLALVQGNIVPVPAVTNGVGGQLRPNISLCPNLVSGAIVGGGGENIGLAVGEEAKNSEWSETRVAAIQAVQTEDLQALAARRSARQAELLNEGKRRWAAYRQRQQSGDLGESALVEGME